MKSRTYIKGEGTSRYMLVRCWNNDETEWLEDRAYGAWVSWFVWWPRKSIFTGERIWGKCNMRQLKVMSAGYVGPAPRFTQYATDKQVFEDKLKGAL